MKIITKKKKFQPRIVLKIIFILDSILMMSAGILHFLKISYREFFGLVVNCLILTRLIASLGLTIFGLCYLKKKKIVKEIEKKIERKFGAKKTAKIEKVQSSPKIWNQKMKNIKAKKNYSKFRKEFSHLQINERSRGDDVFVKINAIKRKRKSRKKINIEKKNELEN